MHKPAPMRLVSGQSRDYRELFRLILSLWDK